MKEKKQCYHCGTTEGVNYGAYWIYRHDLCKSYKNKYIMLQCDQHSQLRKFFSKAGVRNLKEERKLAYPQP